MSLSDAMEVNFIWNTGSLGATSWLQAHETIPLLFRYLLKGQKKKSLDWAFIVESSFIFSDLLISEIWCSTNAETMKESYKSRIIESLRSRVSIFRNITQEVIRWKWVFCPVTLSIGTNWLAVSAAALFLYPPPLDEPVSLFCCSVFRRTPVHCGTPRTLMNTAARDLTSPSSTTATTTPSVVQKLLPFLSFPATSPLSSANTPCGLSSRNRKTSNATHAQTSFPCLLFSQQLCLPW